MELRVLVVEDEFLIASMIEAHLTRLGCQVEPPVATVEAALGVLAGREIDLAIVDVNLGGRDSFPVADALQARDIPFVFTTGYGQLGLSERYRHSPVLQKPFRMRDLDAILPALRTRAPGSGSA